MADRMKLQAPTRPMTWFQGAPTEPLTAAFRWNSARLAVLVAPCHLHINKRGAVDSNDPPMSSQPPPYLGIGVAHIHGLSRQSTNPNSTVDGQERAFGTAEALGTQGHLVLRSLRDFQAQKGERGSPKWMNHAVLKLDPGCRNGNHERHKKARNEGDLRAVRTSPAGRRGIHLQLFDFREYGFFVVPVIVPRLMPGIPFLRTFCDSLRLDEKSAPE